MTEDIAKVAQLLGKRGGEQTRKRGSAYFARIGRLGLERRWGKRSGQPRRRAAKQERP